MTSLTEVGDIGVAGRRASGREITRRLYRAVILLGIARIVVSTF